MQRHLERGVVLDRLDVVDAVGVPLEALLGEAVGDHDQAPVALRSADERERRPRAAARVLDDRVARRDRAVALGALDHRERHPVLERARWIRVLELEPQLRAVRRRAACQSHERRVSDRVESRGQRVDGRRNAPGCAGMRAAT
jgi:hypothetical protein